MKLLNKIDLYRQNNNSNNEYEKYSLKKNIYNKKIISKKIWLKNKRRITIPCSPKLLTKYRTRPSLYKGRQRQELEYFEKQPKIHALPLNTKIFHKTYGIPECKKKSLTIPHSPNLTKKKLKYSIQNIKISSNDCTNNNIDKSLNKNYYSILYNKNEFKSALSQNNPSLTSLSFVPFHLPGDEISKKKNLIFEEKIRKDEEKSKQLRQFIANPIPKRNKKDRLSKSLSIPIPLIQPIPFNLITEIRGEKYQRIFKNNIKIKQKEENKLRNFVARPPISLFKIPFTISKSNKPLTEFKDIKFKTEIRAAEWIKYKNHLKERNDEIEKIKKQQEEFKKLCEKQWIKEQRKKTIIHANPLPSFIYKSKNF